MLSLNKACSLEDFRDPALASILIEYFGNDLHSEPDWPNEKEDRKFWEVAMIVLAVQRCLPIEERYMALGVGAGIEATNFILSKLFKWVFLTDLYGAKGWREDAPSGMLIDPTRFAQGFPVEPRRIVVQHMSATDLRFESNSFALVYSSSSIEHFGSRGDVKVAAKEMGRVVRPGGIISLSTELKLSGERDALNSSTLLFTRQELEELIVEPSGCVLVDTPDYEVSEATVLTPTLFSNAINDLPQMSRRYVNRWSTYPHIVLKDHDLSWTSAQITLRKPSDANL